MDRPVLWGRTLYELPEVQFCFGGMHGGLVQRCASFVRDVLDIVGQFGQRFPSPGGCGEVIT